MLETEVSREELRNWDQNILWHSFTQMSEYQPLIIDRAQGCVLTDIDGNELIDGVSSLWCNVHGHQHPRLNAAIIGQLNKVAHFTQLGASSTPAVMLAKRLIEIVPEGLTHVFFSSDGSNAIEVALKMAFQYWQQRSDPQPEKTRFAALGDAYHGDTIGSVSLGGMDLFHELFRPLLFSAVHTCCPDTYRLPEGVSADEALSHYLSKVEEMLAEHHHQLAAMIVEPLVQGAAGIILHPVGFLHGLRQLTKKYDVLLIADEVAVGFGKTGTMFACEQEQVQPDILCLGKGLSGGYLPVSATLATDEVYHAFLGTPAERKTLFHGHTFGGNPLGCAAAMASLDLFEEEQVLTHLPNKIEYLAEQLIRLGDRPCVGSVRQRGLIAAVELVQDRQHKTPYDWREKRGAQVCQWAVEHGVWLRPLGDVIVIMPPLAIELDQLKKIVDTIEAGIIAVTENS